MTPVQRVAALSKQVRQLNELLAQNRTTQSTLVHGQGQAVGAVQAGLAQLAGTLEELSKTLRKPRSAKYGATRMGARSAASVHSSSDAIVGTNLEGSIITWNKGAESIYGYCAEEAVGRPVSMLAPAAALPELYALLDKIHRGEAVEPFETMRIKKDGTVIDVWLSVSAIRNAAGTVIAASEIAREITAEKRGQEMRARLAAIVESSTDAILSRTVDGTVTSWNRGAELMFGYSAEEMIGRNVLILAPPERAGAVAANIQRTGDGERVAGYETVGVTKHGERIDISVTVSPIVDSHGRVTGGATIIRDITEQKRNESALRKQNEILQKTLDHLPVLVSMVDPDGHIKLVNREWERVIGWTLEEIERQGIDVLAQCCPNPSSQKKFRGFVAAASGEWRDFPMRVRNGSVIETTWAVTQLSDATLIGIGADITERKRAAQQIKALHQINLAITSTLDLKLILQLLLQKIDMLMPYAAAHIRLLNPVTGVLESVACRNLDEKKWKGLVLPSHGSLSESIIRSRTPVMVANMQTDPRVVRRELFREFGLVSFLGLPLVFNDQTIGILSVFTEQEREFTHDEFNFMRALAEQASIAIHNSQLYEQGRQLTRDLLAKQTEIRTLLARVINARDEEAERIAQEVHDESGQLLAAVYITLDQIEKGFFSPHEGVRKAKELLQHIEERLRHLSHELHPTIVKNLGFAAALDHLVAQASQRSEIAITATCLPNGGLSAGLGLTLYRVIQEALNNAIRHSGARRIEIVVSEGDNRIECSVEDDGAGFDPAALGSGGGLGLVGIRERVELWNGRFELLSAPNQGTKLFISLPHERSDPEPAITEE